VPAGSAEAPRLEARLLKTELQRPAYDQRTATPSAAPSSEHEEAMQSGSVQNLKEEILHYLRSEFSDQISETIRNTQVKMQGPGSTPTSAAALGGPGSLRSMPGSLSGGPSSLRAPITSVSVAVTPPNVRLANGSLADSGSKSVQVPVLVEQPGHRSPMLSARGMLDPNQGRSVPAEKRTVLSFVPPHVEGMQSPRMGSRDLTGRPSPRLHSREPRPSLGHAMPPGSQSARGVSPAAWNPGAGARNVVRQSSFAVQ